MFNKITLTSIFSLLSLSALAQSTTPQSHSDIEVTAVVDAGCFLTADNINFGVIMMPLQNQSAQSQINVKCSKNANLILSISYNPSAISQDIYTAVADPIYTTRYNFKLYKNGVPISSNSIDMYCHSELKGGSVHFATSQAEILYFGEDKYNDWVKDTWNICSGVNLNLTTLSNLGAGANGALVGVAKGETIIYTLETPSDSSKVWNAQNTYSFISNGENQTIPMKANIKSSNNPTYRISPDTYTDSLSVILTY